MTLAPGQKITKYLNMQDNETNAKRTFNDKQALTIEHANRSNIETETDGL